MPGRNIGIKPFVAAGITDGRSATQTAMQRTRSLGKIKDYEGGVDAKYGLTKSLTLDLTYHTDFAQVEADRLVVWRSNRSIVSALPSTTREIL